MKKMFTTACFFLLTLSLFAATFRTYVGHTVSGNTYTIWANSNTEFGEKTIGQIKYTPNGGGGDAFTGFIDGTFDNTTVMGANWKIVITVPANSTNLLLELANKNQSGSSYGFSGTNISLNNVLAVQLNNLSVVAKSQNVHLSWLTSAENENALFEVERRNNVNQWLKIGEVKSKGNSVTAQTYDFTDENPTKGINYYRIKDVDKSGKINYSKVISVALEGKNKTLLFRQSQNQKCMFSMNPIKKKIRLYRFLIFLGVWFAI
ncbi:MAG: hypothetical protein HC817_05285 [Saprospiraceae bacterium]|nr:hypothetical protein [Saprospiraceae bacterium]